MNKPVCVADYNRNMNGVDRLDQNLSYYPPLRKTLKWHKKLTCYLMQIACHNAFILFRLKNPESKIKSLSAFILSVSRSWASPYRGSDDEDLSPTSSTTPPRIPQPSCTGTAAIASTDPHRAGPPAKTKWPSRRTYYAGNSTKARGQE